MIPSSWLHESLTDQNIAVRWSLHFWNNVLRLLLWLTSLLKAITFFLNISSIRNTEFLRCTFQIYNTIIHNTYSYITPYLYNEWVTNTTTTHWVWGCSAVITKKKVHLLFFIIYCLFFYFSLPLLTSGFLYVKLFCWNCNRDRHGRRRRESAQHFCFICRNSENSITNISACAKEEFTGLFLSWILSLVPSQFRPVCKKNEMNRLCMT